MLLENKPPLVSGFFFSDLVSHFRLAILKQRRR